MTLHIDGVLWDAMRRQIDERGFAVLAGWAVARTFGLRRLDRCNTLQVSRYLSRDHSVEPRWSTWDRRTAIMIWRPLPLDPAAGTPDRADRIALALELLRDANELPGPRRFDPAKTRAEPDHRAAEFVAREFLEWLKRFRGPSQDAA